MKGLMTHIILLMALILVIRPVNLVAQPSGNEMQYLINPSFLAPVLFEDGDRFLGFYTYRTDWTGFSGHPEEHYLDISGIIHQKMLLGGQIQYVTADIFRYFYFSLRYALKIRIAENHRLTLGIDGVFFNTIVDLTGAVVYDPMDPLINGKERISQVGFNIGAGLGYQLKTFSFCLYSPMLLNNRSEYDQAVETTHLTLPRNLFIYLSNDFLIVRKWLIKPAFLVKMTSDAPTVMELSVIGGLADHFWLGMLYRTNKTMGITAGVEFWDRLLFSYGYEFFTGSTPGVHTGTHEITLGLKISNPKVVTPELKDYFTTPVSNPSK